ncbi:MAG: NAD(P)H-dependent oxidoreductase [Cyanobacteria bacterium P01_F01_bin.53]
MDAITILFLNCTPKRSPEVSNTEALWDVLAEAYQTQGYRTEQLRTADHNILLPNSFPDTITSKSAIAGGFPYIFQRIQAASILIVGTPVRQGMRSLECQKLIERLYSAQPSYSDPATGHSLLYNKVFGLLLVGDSAGVGQCTAQTCQDFSRLGYTLPPNNTVTWVPPMDSQAGFIEADGQYSIAVNAAAELLVETSTALARALQAHPLTANVHRARDKARVIAQSANVDTATQISPKSIRTNSSISAASSETHQTADNSIDYRQVTKRIWTVMQAGMARGFTFKIISLRDRTFRAERDGKGFIYKIYPGHYSFRSQYQDYDYEQSKSHKLSLMQAKGLAIPTAYGLFKTFSDICSKFPVEQLPFPLVAKPNSGSLSENVFVNLTTPLQLEHAAAVIEATGQPIQLESHILGRDYRVLITNHQYAGCVERRPANVTGDGQHSILELFHLRNKEPGRGDRYEAHTTIHKLVFDDASRQLLQDSGYTLNTVLPAGERFYLQGKITAATGSDYVDCTEQLHPSIVESCIEFSRRFSTLTLGFDLITTDISKPLSETGGAFNEYNFIPYVDLHENCNIGKKRSVCHLIWDYIEEHEADIVTPYFHGF